MCSGLGNRRPTMTWAHWSPVLDLAFSLTCWLSKYEFAHQAIVEGPTRVKGLVARPNAKGSIVHMLHVCIIQRWVGYTQFSQDKSKTRDVCLDEWTWIIQIVFLYRTMNSDLNNGSYAWVWHSLPKNCYGEQNMTHRSVSRTCFNHPSGLSYLTRRIGADKLHEHGYYK